MDVRELMAERRAIPPVLLTLPDNMALRYHPLLHRRYPVVRLRLRQDRFQTPQVPEEPGSPRDQADRVVNAYHVHLHRGLLRG